MLQRKGTETQQVKEKWDPCPLRLLCYCPNCRVFRCLYPLCSFNMTGPNMQGFLKLTWRHVNFDFNAVF